MSNGVHPRQQREDSGTQPDPHYCTSRVRGDGTTAGCPEWPACLFPGLPADIVQQRMERFDRVLAEDEAADRAERREDWQRVGRDLAALAGWAVGAVLVLIVAAILLPLFV